MVFYTLEQAATAPVLTRRTSCLTCHVSASTLNVPGLIVRSNIVGDDGNVMPRLGSNDVNHGTPHPDRWGGWFVTSDLAAASYAQRAHTGNITFTRGGSTSNQVFVDWLNSSPETRGYLSPLSDMWRCSLDHQCTRSTADEVNWESRSVERMMRRRRPALRASSTIGGIPMLPRRYTVGH